jgi:hypothetical protein
VHKWEPVEEPLQYAALTGLDPWATGGTGRVGCPACGIPEPMRVITVTQTNFRRSKAPRTKKLSHFDALTKHHYLRNDRADLILPLWRQFEDDDPGAVQDKLP